MRERRCPRSTARRELLAVMVPQALPDRPDLLAALPDRPATQDRRENLVSARQDHPARQDQRGQQDRPET